MRTRFDNVGIAARIRGLISGQDEGEPALAAKRMHVDETGLRMSIDELAPNPTISVIAAVIQEYGVDPTWLLKGTYDPVTHRKVLAEEPTDVLGMILTISSDPADDMTHEPRLRILKR